MSKSLGDFDTSAVIYGKFATFRPSTGATFTLGGTPALSVYKDNSLTQSTTGVTLTADFDGVTGFNHFAIDTSADGTFYSAGSFFDVVITTGTVDSISVTGSVVGSFTLRKTSALKPATAGRTLVVDASGLADANTVKLGPSGSGTAQTARDIGASVITASGTVTTVTNQLTAAQIATGVWQDATAGDFTAANSIGKSVMNGVALGTGLTVAAVSGAVGSVTGAVASVTGNVGGNVVGSVGSVTGAVASVTGNVGGNVVGSVASVTAGVTVTTNNDKTGYALSATGSAALTESYAGDGVAPTLNQAIYQIMQFLHEKSISGTTMTVKKIDGSTSAMTFTLSDATTPTSITRAT